MVKYDDSSQRYIKYRSIVSSISFEFQSNASSIYAKTRWTHVGTNLHRLPHIQRRFTLVNKIRIGGYLKGINSLSVSHKAHFLALGLNSGEVQLRKIGPTMQNNGYLELCPPSEKPEINSIVSCVKFVKTLDNILFSSSFNGEIDVYDTEKLCKHTITKEKDNEINSIDLTSNASKIISGGKDTVLRLYDGVTGELITKTESILMRSLFADPNKFHQMRIHCVKFDPENENIFFSGGLDGYVKMWDIRDQLVPVKTFRGPYIRGHAIDICKNILLTASWRSSKALDLWNITNGKHVESLTPTNRSSTLDSEFFECVKFFNRGQEGTGILVGGSGTGRFEVFNLTERKIEFAVKVDNSVKCIENISSTIFFGALDGICRVVKYD